MVAGDSAATGGRAACAHGGAGGEGAEGQPGVVQNLGLGDMSRVVYALAHLRALAMRPGVGCRGRAGAGAAAGECVAERQTGVGESVRGAYVGGGGGVRLEGGGRGLGRDVRRNVWYDRLLDSG